MVASHENDAASGLTNDANNGPSIGLVVAMAAIGTGLVVVALGLAVRHIRKRRATQGFSRQNSMTTEQSTDDLEAFQDPEMAKNSSDMVQ